MARTVDETIYLILSLGQVMAQAPDLESLYEAIGYGADLVYQLYPHIDCHTGCNRCCRNNSLLGDAAPLAAQTNAGHRGAEVVVAT